MTARKNSWWHWHLAGAAYRLEVCATKAAGTEARLTNLFMFYE
jgi:hypothetical protein